MTELRNQHQTVLAVVDMQNCFFEVDALAKQRARLTWACNELMTKAHEALVPVIMVRTEHQRDRSTWTLNMRHDNQGFALAGDQDSFTLSELPTWATIQVLKTRDSAFHKTNLEEVIRQTGANHIILAGVSTHSCIALTAADAYALDFEVTLAEDVIFSERPELHEPTLNHLHGEYRQGVKPNSEIEFA